MGDIRKGQLARICDQRIGLFASIRQSTHVNKFNRSRISGDFDYYEHDNQLLYSLNSDEEILTAWNICKDRMDHHRQEILANIARNSKASFADKIKAWHLICELQAADLRIREETAARVARTSALSVKRAMMLKEEKEEEEC